jgi:hypothetical protein
MHAANAYIETVQDTIRQIYSFFAKSPKRLRGLEEIAKECEVTLAKLHYVFEVRMVESEVIAIKNFLTDIPEIITYLEKCVAQDKASGNTSVTTIKQQGWIRQITQFKFISHCLILLDIDVQLQVFSQRAQSDCALALDIPGYLDELRYSLRRLNQGAFGTHVQQNLAGLRFGKYRTMTLRHAPKPSNSGLVCHYRQHTEGFVHASIQVEATTCVVPNVSAEDLRLAAEIAEAPPTPQRDLEPDDEGADSASDDEENLEVQAILSRRPRGRGFQYLILWKGYPQDQATWEATSRLSCPALLDEFNAANEKAAPGAEIVVHASRSQAPPRVGVMGVRELPARVTANRRYEEEQLSDGKTTVTCLQDYQTALVKVLLEKFDKRLPLPDTIKHLRNALDFRQMPLQHHNERCDPLLTYGEESLRWLVENKLPQLDVSTVLNQALAVRLHVRDNRGQWVVDIEKKDPKTNETSIIGTKFQLCEPPGSPSLFHTLFTEHVVTVLSEPPAEFLQVHTTS